VTRWPGARLAVVALAVLSAMAVGACGRDAKPPAAAVAAPRHLVIVTIDTLRADRLGAYGNTTVPTPHFDRLAREGTRALDATTHAPITRPSHTTLFTGRYPAEHGVRDNISLPLAKDIPTLAETLKAHGFTTAAFVSTFVLASSSGLNRGFDHYDDLAGTGGPDGAASLSQAQRRGDATLARVEQWLATRGADASAARTALWVHLYDPHDPYEPPAPFSAGCAPASKPASCGMTRSCSSPQTTARRSGNTAKPDTASSPTRPHSRCRSCCVVRACRPAAPSTARFVWSTPRRPCWKCSAFRRSQA